MNDKITKEMSDNIAKDKEESQAELAKILNEKDEKNRASLIEQQIAKLEKQTKGIEWAVRLAKLGFDVATKFIGPLAIGGSLVKLLENTAKATARACDAYIFLEQRQDMLNAASPYSSPVANFVDNARLQAAHYAINAAMDGLNMAGAIVETLGYATGPGAAIAVTVGKLMQASAQSAQALEAVCYEIKKRVDLERAWSFYRQALTRPENRKLGLMAMQKNPTLAKFAVAWGAIIKKDVLVVDFVQRTGLTAESLRDPKAKVADAVKYLELRFSDDNVVVGRKVEASWAPEKVELTLACFAATKARAIKSGKLEDSPTRTIEMALANFESEAKSIYDKFSKALAANHPIGTDGMKVPAGGHFWHKRALYHNAQTANRQLPAWVSTDLHLSDQGGRFETGRKACVSRQRCSISIQATRAKNWQNPRKND